MSDILHDILVKDDSASRKLAPVYEGVMRYFPRAMKAVAYLSKMGNDKHNPDAEHLGWSWNRSDDHGDCIARHQLEPEQLDEYGLPHCLAVAWRAMAQLEKYLVERYDLDLPPAAYLVPDHVPVSPEEEAAIDKAAGVTRKAPPSSEIGKVSLGDSLAWYRLKMDEATGDLKYESVPAEEIYIPNEKQAEAQKAWREHIISKEAGE